MQRSKNPMEGSHDHKVSKEEVIGSRTSDFDRLRCSIIQKLKNNEELREVITFIVKQSAALNREGAENVKPRHLSDDIYLEVGSSDGMKSEIAETVRSVYNKLTNPNGEAEGEASTRES